MADTSERKKQLETDFQDALISVTFRSRKGEILDEYIVDHNAAPLPFWERLFSRDTRRVRPE
jgi:hypothetical protein